MSNPGVTGGAIATYSDSFSLNNLEARGMDGLASAGGVAGGLGSVLDALGPKASEIFETRSATGIWESHQEIATLNIGGAAHTGFSENENLYGFSIFKFQKGFTGGWSSADVNSLLGMDLNSMLGEDKLRQASSYFFNLHPKAINVTEPFATHIIPTQGGGIYTESQGIILRPMTITGTTGYRPSIAGQSSTDRSNVIPWTAGEETGYLNFLKLRNVFRNYADLKKDNSLSYKVYMVWFNNREQEAWFFEPSNFTTVRDASSPFTYTYTISGTLTQKVNFSTIVNTINPDPTSPHFQIAAMRRSASMLNGILSYLVPGLGDDVVGEALQAGRQLLNIAAEIDQVATNVHMTLAGVASLPALIAGSFAAAGRLFASKWDTLSENQAALWGADNVAEWGENWSVSSKKFLDGSYAANSLQHAAGKLAQPEILTQIAPLSSPASKGAATGGANSSVPKTALAFGNKVQDLLEDPAIGWGGVQVSDGDQTIEDLCEQHLGDASAADAVAVYNNLDSPYITTTPSYIKGNNKVLTQGDTIYLPFPKEIISGDINTKINPAKASLSLYEEALGRDIRLTKSTQATTGVSEFNLSISPTGDLDVIAGSNNIKQAIEIKLNTERGELSIHPQFGLVPVMGQKGTKFLNLDLYLSLHSTMLSDGRIKELVGTRVNTTGDKVSVQTKVYVIGQVPYVPLSFTLGG